MHGVELFGPLFREVETRPDAPDTEAAVDNFIVAASAATGRNLLRLFEERWRFPVSGPARVELQRRFRAPVDPALYRARSG